ncbi:MAG: serine--tRNA ligase, partial [Moorella sp. (in: Bacteria)]|nr:serine--tRNA ligase [Moorella sp. (in: firmicutes)]
MLDIKLIRQEPERVAAALTRRGLEAGLEHFLELDARRRNLLVEVEGLKNKRNQVSAEVARLKKSGRDATALIASMREVGERIKELDEAVRTIEEKLQQELLRIPNLPHESVPDGLSDADNEPVRHWGEIPRFDFEPRPHWEIAEHLGIIDFERGSKVAGARFVFYRGAGARLERALINFMLDLHTIKHGYTEFFPPFLVNSASMTGTGQLPKFAQDMFHVEGTDYYLIPTAEVPVTNLYRGEILDGDLLPLYHVAYSACFRAEAGAAGRDTRGLIRQHQFNKVEL